MATLTFVNTFAQALAHGVHDLETDQLKVALCAAASPPTAADAVLTDLTEIAYTNLSSRDVTTSSSGLVTTNDYALALADLVLTASGGSVAGWRYVVLYNEDAANDEIIGFLDYGTDQVLGDGDTRTIKFSDDNAVEFTVA